jgi:hypothetical protein
VSEWRWTWGSGDRLDIIKRGAAAACDISEEAGPAWAVEEAGEKREAAVERGTERDAAGDGVALLVRAAGKFGVEQLRLEAGEVGRGKDVGNDDEAVAVEGLTQFGGEVGR